MSTSNIANLYNPLDENEIRYLVLLAGDFHSPIECRLIQGRNLAADIGYEALSYEWGPPQPEVVITVNGMSISIRENLRNALRRLQKERGDRVLWVDAICINQDDIPERNAQVSIMSSIYRKADEVLAWLGEEDGDIRWLFNTISEHKQGFWEHVNQASSDAWNKTRQALNHFFNWSYWTRVWIIQELFSASRLSFWVGSEKLPWSVFRQAISPKGHNDLKRVAGLKGPGKQITDEFDEYDFPLALRANSRVFSDLVRLCFECNSQCSDIRDRIYGLISISNDIGPDDITVDYAKHPARLYLDVMKASIFPSFSSVIVGPGTKNLSHIVQKLLGNPLWDPISTSICLPMHTECRETLEEFTARRLTLQLFEGYYISGVQSNITSIDQSQILQIQDQRKEFLRERGGEPRSPYPRQDVMFSENTAADAPNFTPQELHQNSFLGLTNKKLLYGKDEASKPIITYVVDARRAPELWEVPTDERSRIFQLQTGAVGLASCHVQPGDRLFRCPQLDNLLLVFRGWDEAQHDGSDFTLVGRATKLDFESWNDYGPPLLRDRGSTHDTEMVDWEVDLATLLLLIR